MGDGEVRGQFLVDRPWGVVNGKDMLMSQGWGEFGQCMMKTNCKTEEIAIVMTKRNPVVDQTESGVEWLVNRKLRV